MKRRQLFRYSLSFFLGLNLVYLKSKSVKSENSPDSGDGNNLITSVSGIIPSGLSLKFFQNVLSPNETFNNYYSHFVNQGFKFKTDLMNSIDIKSSTKEPFFFTQLFGEKEFESEKTMLVESVSLSSVYTGKGLLNLGASGAILANKFNYDNPLIQALIFYPSSENLFEYEKIERDFLEKESPETIANKIRELKRKSIPETVSGNSLDEIKKNERLDLDTSLFVNNVDNFLFLMLSIQLNIESSIKEFDHSDKYILEKFSKIIVILIDEYKAEIEKLKRLSMINRIASLPEANYGLLGNKELFMAFLLDPVTWTIIGVVVTIISIVTTIYGCSETTTTTQSEKPVETTMGRDNNGNVVVIGSIEGSPTINIYSTTATVQNSTCPACGK